MASPHANVAYVEPNYVGYNDKNGHAIQMAPDLSDLCIAMNLEVEVLSRTRTTSVNDGNKTYILTWRQSGKGGKSTISFLEGKKIYVNTPKNDSEKLTNKYINSLTTDYTDVYLRDIVDYGDTEMFGIKSVNVTYEKFQIPHLTVVFTDVRGMALFQPSELRRTNNLDGNKSFSEDEVAQSFFQCFFTQPYPKFTFYLKGYYGEPVAYEMNCSDFRTRFDSSTGNFDVTVQFIGYMFSFLSDISFNALLAAPYTSYGAKYWEKEVANNRFVMKDRYGHIQKMPTLMDIYCEAGNVEDMITEYNNQASKEAMSVIDKKIQAFNGLFDHVKKILDAVVDYANKKENASIDSSIEMFVASDNTNDYNCYVLLFVPETTSDTLDGVLDEETIKKINNSATSANTCASEADIVYIVKPNTEEFKDRVFEKKDENGDVVKDENGKVVQITPQKIGFSEEPNVIDITSETKYTGDNTPITTYSYTVNSTKKQYESTINRKFNQLAESGKKNEVLAKLNNGYKCYIFDVDTSFINSNISDLNKGRQKRSQEIIEGIKERNTSWYPSIENFTKCVVAHFETMMKMIYDCVDKIYGENRTIKDFIGATSSNFTDINDADIKDGIISPFPRISAQKQEDGVTKEEDIWLGTINGGTKGFREVDLIEDFMNGANVVIKTVGIDIDKRNENQQLQEMVKNNIREIMPNFVTPYDPFLYQNPYFGPDTKESVFSILGKVGARMSYILRKSWGSNQKIIDSDLVKDIAEAEAINFYAVHKTRNEAIAKVLGYTANGQGISGEDALAILKCDSSNETARSYIDSNRQNLPWDVQSEVGHKALLDGNNDITQFKTKDEKSLFPIGSFTFGEIKSNAITAYNSGKVYNDLSINTTDLPKTITYQEYLNADVPANDASFTIFTNPSYVKDHIESARTVSNENTAITKLFDAAILADASLDNGSKFNNVDTYFNLIDTTSEYRCFYKGLIPFTKRGEVLPFKRYERSIPKPGYDWLYDDENHALYGWNKAGVWVKYHYREYVDVDGKKESKSTIVERETGAGDRIDDKNSYDGYREKISTHTLSSFTNDYKIAYIYSTKDDKVTYSKNQKIGIKRLEPNHLFFDYYVDSDGKKVNFSSQLMILGVKAINYERVINRLKNDSDPFLFMPNIALLQMGALADEMLQLKKEGEKNNINEEISQSESLGEKSLAKKIFGDTNELVKELIKKIPLDAFEDDMPLITALHDINNENVYKNVKSVLDYFKSCYDNGKRNIVYRLGRYYRENVDRGPFKIPSNTNELYHKIIFDSVYDPKTKKPSTYSSYILYEYNPYITELTNYMMVPCIIVRSHLSKRNVSNNVCISYLNSFFTKLKDLYDSNDTNDYITLETVSKSVGTTDDMRIAMYQYIKALYDKWVPTNNFSSWKLESFFGNEYGESSSNVNLHSFFFIDSYYLNIGKLKLDIKYIREKIEQVFGSNNYRGNLLSFLNDVYSKHNCMLLSVQNFIDMTSSEKMLNMFSPIAFNNMRSPKKYPDFVVLYPYAADKIVNLADKEFKSASFMLNDVQETPVPITTRSDDTSIGFKVPAFGVSYGSQYQSYFKNINVGMENPMVTEQAMKAKYAIIDPRFKESKARVGTIGQDLFDIYSDTSYTCEIEMMGCAWVQPLMYFVLLNIPMFKGSYLIQNVSHTMEPGGMTTKIVGVRMARVATPIVKEYLNYAFDNDQQLQAERIEHQNADITNDCKYEVYPVIKVNGRNMSEVLNGKLKDNVYYKVAASKGFTPASGFKPNEDTVLDAFSKLIYQENNSAGELGYAAEALTIYNRYTTLTEARTSQVFSTQQFNGWSDFTDNKITAYNGVKDSIQRVVESVWENPSTVKNFSMPNKEPGVAIPSSSFSNLGVKTVNLNAITNSEDTLSKVYMNGDIAAYPGKYHKVENILFVTNEKAYANDGNNGHYWKQESNQTNQTLDINKLMESFAESIQNSANSSDKAKCEIVSAKTGTNTLQLSEKSSSSDKHLEYIFDIILNTPEYLQYVDELKWVTKNSVSNFDADDDHPIRVDAKLSYNARDNKTINIGDNKDSIRTSVDKLPKPFMNAAFKYCGRVNPLADDKPLRANDFPVFAYKNDTLKEEFTKVSVNMRNCNDVVDEAMEQQKVYGTSETIDGERKDSNGRVFNVGKAIEYFKKTRPIVENKQTKKLVFAGTTTMYDNIGGKNSKGVCARAIADALAVGFTDASTYADLYVVNQDGSLTPKEIRGEYTAPGVVIENGGIKKVIDQGYAYTMAYKLPNLGFKVVPDNEPYQIGDIMVFDKSDEKKIGHVTMYIGNATTQCDFRSANGKDSFEFTGKHKYGKMTRYRFA